MANVSSSNGLEKRPKLRFPGFDGPIKSAHLSQYLVENKERNKNLIYTKSDVLSVSGEYGIVNQIEFQGRSFAGESVAEYHVVETNDIVYTKSPLKANPYGIIKVNNGAPGIVSTLYAVYHPCEGTVAEYIDYYFGNDLGQFTRNYTQTVKRAADNKRRYAPGWVHSTCLLRGFPKGAAPHLAHDFAEQSVVCYTLCRRCPENTVAAGEGKGI